MKTKVEFEVRNYSINGSSQKEGIATIEEAHKLCNRHNQCTWEETQSAQSYSHIIEYRDDELYNELYFN